MSRHQRFRRMPQHELERVLVARTVDFLTADGDDETLAALRAAEPVWRESDRRRARAGVVPTCVCEECFKGFTP